MCGYAATQSIFGRFQRSGPTGQTLPLPSLPEGDLAAFKERINMKKKTANQPKRNFSPGVRRLLKVLNILWRVVLSTFLVVVITGCIVITALTVYVMKFMDDDTGGIDLSNPSLAFTTILYSTDYENNEYVEMQRLYEDENRVWVGIEDIPNHVKYAAIAIEDQRFEKHDGVDWWRTFGAFGNLFLHYWDTRQGASTITQQVVRSLSGDDDVRIDRKIREIFRAMNLEKLYTKDEILEAYLNVVNYGGRIQGIQAASKAYFNKDVWDLTVAEAASIVGITRSPTSYNPYVNPERNKERRERVMRAMFDQGYLTQEEYDAAMAEELVFQKEQYTQMTSQVNSWYVDQVIDDVIKGLVEEYGWTEEVATSKFYNAGYQIYTPMDARVQKVLEDVYSGTVEKYDGVFPTVSGAVQPQSSMVIMGYDGRVYGVAGGIGEKKEARLFNRAFSAVRQPGSTIKPLATYAPAIESDLITWSTKMNDAYKLNSTTWTAEGTLNWPGNSGRARRGMLTVCEALKTSLNTIPVELVMTMTPKTSFDYLETFFGITTLVKSENINGKVMTDNALAPMAIGAMTYGFTTVEEAAAYATFGNGGLYYEPYTYDLVLDSNGNTILEKDSKGKRAISKETAGVMVRLLQQVVKTKDPGGWNGTATVVNFNSKLEIAAKTGTTNDNRDSVFVGMTPNYVGVVWYGYDEEKVLAESLLNVPKYVWKSVMQNIPQPKQKFDNFGGIVELEYCTATGDIAHEGCKSKLKGWYKESNIPQECTECKRPDPKPEEEVSSEPASSQASSEVSSVPVTPEQ